MKKGKTIICKQCGIEKYLYPYYLRLVGVTGYCSNECIALSKGSGVEECIQCKLKVYRQAGHRKAFNKFFCSSECRSKYQKGKRFLPDYEIKKGQRISIGTEFKKGTPQELHPSWRGGLTSKNKRARWVSEYLEWRKKVFERDSYTCQKCGLVGVYLHAHHIVEFAKDKSKRYEISNGQTLCKRCHQIYHGLIKKEESHFS